MKHFLVAICLITLLHERAEGVHHKVCKKPVVIAVIDTGFGRDLGWTKENTPRLCKFGHKDFTNGKSSSMFGTTDPVPVDNHGHGTHITGLVDTYAKKNGNNYCIVIIKFYEAGAWGDTNTKRTTEAIKYAKKIHADFINYSGGGIQQISEETKAVKDFIDAGGTFVAAAGNEGENLKIHPYYPAQADDRAIVVGNGIDEEHRERRSNYGKRVNRWEDGFNVFSIFPNAGHGYLTGTSQSTAIATGKIVAERNKYCK